MDRDTEIEFERLLKTYANRLDADEVMRNMDAIKRQAREHAAGRKLLLDEARRRKIDVSDDELRTAVARLAERSGGEDALNRQLDEQGLTMEALYEKLRDARMTEKLIEMVTADVPESAEPEILSYFLEHRDEFAESADFEQVKDIIKLALTNAGKNEKLADYMDNLKRNS